VVVPLAELHDLAYKNKPTFTSAWYSVDVQSSTEKRFLPHSRVFFSAVSLFYDLYSGFAVAFRHIFKKIPRIGLYCLLYENEKPVKGRKIHLLNL
jgi:hypothetical protein